MGAVFGSLCSLMIGLTDLGARHTTRVIHPLVIAGTIQLIATGVGLATLGAIDSTFLWADVALGAASGLGVSLGLACYLVGLQRSSATVVSPIVGTLSAVIPFAIAVVTGDRPSIVAVAGAALALVGLAIISGGGADATRVRAGVAWGTVSGLGYGVGLGMLLGNSEASGAWPAVAQRLAGFAFLSIVVFVGRETFLPEGRLRITPSPQSDRGLAAWTLFGGVAAGLSIIFFLLGVQADATPAVITASLFPAMTVTVGYFFFGDSFRLLQGVGLVAVLVGVVGVVA